MSGIFLKLLNLSISASWLVLVVLALRLVLKRAPKWVNVLLWGMVALRLMLPFSIESALSLIPSAETVSPEVVQFDPAPTSTSGVTIIDNAVNPSLSESFAAAPLASVNPLYVWTYLAGWVWLIGLAAMLLYALVSYLRLRRRVSASIPLRENIYVCDEVPSPFILGIVRPRIYLPSALDEAQRGSVLSHERAHLARRDHWWKPLGFALLAVYWFNPLLWLAYTLLCRDIELACDERVLRGMDAGQVKDYSSALLACSVPRRMIAACPLAFGEVGVGARVKNALRYKKPAFWVVAASAAVCVVVAVCFLTNPERATMKWAKSLRVEDVARIELFVMPQAIDKQYKDLDTEEIAEAVARINKSRGWYVRSAEPLDGGSTALYVTTTDGVRHTVVNNGNVYLCIDGDAYRNFHIAWPYIEGNAPTPEGFFGESVEPAEDADRVYTDAWSIRVLDGWEREGDSPLWRSGAGTGAYFLVTEGSGLDDKLMELYSAGWTLKYFSDHYRCTLREGESGTMLSLYPRPEGGFYQIESYWSYEGADKWQVRLEEGQLKVMEQSFRVENENSTADALIGSYADDMGSSLTIRKNTDGSYAVDLGIYKFTSVGNTAGSYDPQMNILHISGTADIGGTLAADITADGTGRLIVTLTESPVSTGYLAAGAVFTFWPRVTGYPEYDEVLANICDLRLTGTQGTETEFSSDLLTANDYYQTPGWLLRDLDGDGTPELLLGADWGDGCGVIFNIYRLDGAKAVRVVDGWSRSRYFLCSDGTLAHEWSGGADHWGRTYLRYGETLLPIESVFDRGGVWYHAKGLDALSLEDTQLEDRCKTIPRAEAEQLMERYTKQYEALPFTPFAA